MVLLPHEGEKPFGIMKKEFGEFRVDVQEHGMS